ncbi:glycosyltransferase [candidate division KSB1 bacterium]|nr:glycosyltransferase [candidate division KSB1 bacterium]
MKLSVITISLNNYDGLKRTVNSVLSQDYKDFEYIIIDGGSTDDSIKLISSYPDGITQWVSEPDQGIYNAMNKGIIKAKGDYLHFLNSGDILVDGTVYSRIFRYSNLRADIIYGDIFEIKDNSKQYLQKSLKPEELTLANFNTNARATIQHPGAFIRRHLFENDLYDENYRIIADIHFFIKKIIFENCTVEYLDYPVSIFDNTGLSSQPENWQKTIFERERIFSEFLPPRVLKDYDWVYQIKDSPIAPYMPLLNKTTGFHKLVAKIIGILISVYSLFRK